MGSRTRRSNGDKKAFRLWPIIQRMTGLPAPGTEGYDEAVKAAKQAMDRMLDEQSQMERRRGPLYELSKKNSRLIVAEWQAAGSPRKPAGSGLERSETGQLVRIDTPEWQAWRAWKKRREQLRREHGMAGSGGIHYGRPPFSRV